VWDSRGPVIRPVPGGCEDGAEAEEANVLIYKLLGIVEWRAAQAAGEFQGSGIDLADGYLHFSTGEQVARTAALHFAGATGLAMLTVDTQRLGDQLRWEPSRGGALFPHLYAPLPLAAVVGEVELPDDMPVDEAVARALAGRAAQSHTAR
jgi:uncharacterized protein (DUF952 family)